MVTICVNCFMTRGPSKEHRANEPPPTRRIQERSKGDTTCPTDLPASILFGGIHLGWTICAPPAKALSQNNWPETTWIWYGNPISIKPDSANHSTEQSSWGLLPPLGCPFQIRSLALSACVSPWTIYFWLLDKSPLLGPGKISLQATKWLWESLWGWGLVARGTKLQSLNF